MNTCGPGSTCVSWREPTSSIIEICFTQPIQRWGNVNKTVGPAWERGYQGCSVLLDMTIAALVVVTLFR